MKYGKAAALAMAALCSSSTAGDADVYISGQSLMNAQVTSVRLYGPNLVSWAYGYVLVRQWNKGGWWEYNAVYVLRSGSGGMIALTEDQAGRTITMFAATRNDDVTTTIGRVDLNGLTRQDYSWGGRVFWMTADSSVWLFR